MSTTRDRAHEHPDLRTFGRRRGRKPSARQMRLLAELLPRVAINLAQPAPSRLSALFENPRGAAPVRDVWLEIGFGGAEHLVWQAERHRTVGFIGCEPYEGGLIKALAAIEDKGLSNIRLHGDDARPLLRWLPEASLGRAFVLFPDPWPKQRHAKRRLLGPETLALLARALAPGAELRVATDIGATAKSMLVAMQAEPRFTWSAASPSDWRERPDDWPGTRYEAKALGEGRRCYYFRFMRVSAGKAR